MALFKFIKRLFGTSKSSKKHDEVVETAEKASPSGDKEPPSSEGTLSQNIKKKGTSFGRSPCRPVIAWQMYDGGYKNETDIVIGFDFGTCCSKVILQDGVLKKAYAVHFDDVGCTGNPYLLPTVIAVDHDGCLNLSKKGELVESLKIRFLQNPDRSFELLNGKAMTSAEATSAYIGLALRKVRDWFWEKKRADYQRVKIDWQLNIGMSARSYDDSNLKTLMKKVALAGWNLTLKPEGDICIEDVKFAMVLAERQLSENFFETNSHQLHPDNVCPIPEIIAQVAGYARSPMRQDGMYLLIDVGACTLDVSAFVIYERDGEDLYTILVAEVENLGALFLHRHRISSAEKILRNYVNLKKADNFRAEVSKAFNATYDGIAPLPDIEKYLYRVPSKVLSDYRRGANEFLTECSRVIRKVIKEAKNRKNPNSTAWQKGLPVFLCGGGSQIGVYKSILPHAQSRLKNTGFPGFIKKELPKPKNLETEDIPPRDYHRMSVAYGLSFSSLDLGEIIPPAIVDDLIVNDNVRTITEYFIDKEMV